jgi:hypothetical protein
MKPGAALARLALVLVALLLISCGKKTAPIPPQAVIPAPITGVAYQLDENSVTLSWQAPLMTEQGKRLARINSFIVEKAEYPSSEFCRDCPARYHNVATVPTAGSPADRGDRLSYRDEDLRPDHVYLYRLRTSMGWRLTSLPSEPIVFTWQLPIAAVSGLQADSGEQQISLNWQPPTQGLDGTPVTEPLQYQVFRSVSGHNFLPLDKQLTDPYFKDDQLTNGVDYQYKVRASRISGGTGAFSSPVEARPRDLTPPPAPQGLDTVATQKGTRLFWEPVTVTDLAGYQIFRRSEDEELQLIGTVGASQNSFVDPGVGKQETYYYRLKAFDQAEPANKSPFSDEARTGR